MFVNQVGGNDELIFDGNSMYFDNEGTLRAELPSFTEAWEVIDTAHPGPAKDTHDHDTVGTVHDALVLGVRDYT